MYHPTKILEDKAKLDFAWAMTDPKFAKLYNEAKYWVSIFKWTTKNN